VEIVLRLFGSQHRAMGADFMLSGFAVNRTTNHTNAGGFSERTLFLAVCIFPRVYGCADRIFDFFGK
jgi:hypothetical protein